MNDITHEQLVDIGARALCEGSGDEIVFDLQDDEGKSILRQMSAAFIAAIAKATKEPTPKMWTAGGAQLLRWRIEPFYASKNDAAVLCFRDMHAASPLFPEPSHV